MDLGPHPETFFGVHPYIVEQGKQDLLLPYLVEWKDDLILQHSRAYLNVPGEGFHLPSGVLHAPGTALTIELQEDSDVFAMLQALNAGKIISKELLFKDVTAEDRATRWASGPILDQIDWEISGDPYFYENRHTSPVARSPRPSSPAARKHWIYYNTTKFSGKRLVVKPAASFQERRQGRLQHPGLARQAAASTAHEVEGGLNFGQDELLVSHDAATTPILGREHRRQRT